MLILLSLSKTQNYTGFERSVGSNKYRTKGGKKNTTNEFRYFLKSNFIGVNGLFVLVNLNRDYDLK